MRYDPEQRNSSTDEYRNTRNYKPLNEPGRKKALKGDSSINVNMSHATGAKVAE
jgi:hypothetical protein